MNLRSRSVFPGLETHRVGFSKAWKKLLFPFPMLGKLCAALLGASVFSSAEPALTNAPSAINHSPSTISAVEPPTAAVDTLPDATELLKQVVAGLPSEALTIQARVEGRDDIDLMDKVRLAEMHMEWKGGAIKADYTIRDAFGGNLARLNVERPANGRIAYQAFQGPKLEPAVLTLLDSPIAGLDLNWLDLSLSYLWWPDGRTVDTEHVKGRLCYVVDLPVPRDVSALCSTVRLWIEAKVHVLLQAEAFDAKQKRMRMLRIKSFKKVKDFWMVEDLEVMSYPSKHRSLLSVQEVRRNGVLVNDKPEPPPAQIEHLPPATPVTR